MTFSSDQPLVLHHWSARKLQPIVLLHVALIFGALMVSAHFVFHSMAAVKALAIAALAFLVPLVPVVTSRVEYRLTETGLEQRKLNMREPGEFQEVFAWDQLGHIVPTRHGFKYYKTMNEPSPLRRFFKAHISDAFSGEVHVETGDRDRVLTLVADHAVPASNPTGTS